MDGVQHFSGLLGVATDMERVEIKAAGVSSSCSFVAKSLGPPEKRAIRSSLLQGCTAIVCTHGGHLISWKNAQGEVGQWPPPASSSVPSLVADAHHQHLAWGTHRKGAATHHQTPLPLRCLPMQPPGIPVLQELSFCSRKAIFEKRKAIRCRLWGDPHCKWEGEGFSGQGGIKAEPHVLA